jgi:hypothetical protein
MRRDIRPLTSVQQFLGVHGALPPLVPTSPCCCVEVSAEITPKVAMFWINTDWTASYLSGEIDSLTRWPRSAPQKLWEGLGRLK